MATWSHFKKKTIRKTSDRLQCLSLKTIPNFIINIFFFKKAQIKVCIFTRPLKLWKYLLFSENFNKLIFIKIQGDIANKNTCFVPEQTFKITYKSRKHLPKFWNSNNQSNFNAQFFYIIMFTLLARRHGLVVMADDSWSRGLEFEPRHRILDGCKLC